jgi:hypothetical protein
MSRLDEHFHDWDRQFRETEDVWSTLKKQGVDFEKPYCLDLQFIPRTKAADKTKFAAALEEANFKVSFYDDDPTVEASVLGILLTPDTIWLHEKHATEIAFRFGFAPDGWGFLDESEQ